MKHRGIGLVGLLGLTGAMVLSGVPTAYGGQKYQSTIVPAVNNFTEFSLVRRPGTIMIRPSVRPGDGGIVIRMGLRGVDCPAVGNDRGRPGRCGVAGNPSMHHVLALSVTALGMEIPDAVGILYRLERGKAVFEATGKTTVTGAAFGPLASAIFNQPLGIGRIELHAPGSDPSQCGPLPGPGCLDAPVYARTGITVGTDPGITCTTAADCKAPTMICSAGKCVTEPCTVDSDCDSGGGVGGTGECGFSGLCCDPSLDPDCPDEVP